MSDGLRELYEAGLSLPEIANETGIPVSTVRGRILRNGGQLRSRKEAGATAVARGRFAGRTHQRGPVSEETRAKLRQARINWAVHHSRGTRVTSNGYVEFTRGEHKGRAVHDVMVERAIGRRLLSYEVVHHRDHDRQNNNIDNLELMTRSAHTSLHRQEAPRG